MEEDCSKSEHKIMGFTDQSIRQLIQNLSFWCSELYPGDQQKNYDPRLNSNDHVARRTCLC